MYHMIWYNVLSYTVWYVQYHIIQYHIVSIILLSWKFIPIGLFNSSEDICEINYLLKNIFQQSDKKIKKTLM